jgi:hypothetical protein
VSSGFARGKVENPPHRKKLRRKIPTDDVQIAEEAFMAITYYVALPFIRTEDDTAPGEARECQSEAAAIRRDEGMSRDPAYAGAVAFKRAGDPNIGEFSERSYRRSWRCAGRFERAVKWSYCCVMTGTAAAGFAVSSPGHGRLVNFLDFAPCQPRSLAGGSTAGPSH